MQKLEIKGGRKISGTIEISGSKNATLPILASTILTEKEVLVTNIPIVKDVETMADLLRSIGSNVKLNKKTKKIKILNKKPLKTFAPYHLLKTMRAGVLILGSLLSKYKVARVSLPGGCAIGLRPINFHLNALKKMGAKIKIKNGYIIASSKKGLKGCLIKFPKISVGATENLIIASSMAEGTTILSNCAIEPEIKDLVNFINCMGGKIKWIGKRTLKIQGVNNLKEAKYTIMPDRIEAGTYLIAAAVTEGNLKISGINPNIIRTEIEILKKIGAKIKSEKNHIRVIGIKDIKSINLKTSPYPGFPTDLQAQLMVLLCKSKKHSVISEEIFENRFMHVAELRRLGAKITIKDNKATIEGGNNFQGAELMSSDLRASVALVLAAIVANGQSIINRIYHLDRGYEKIETKLSNCGAQIRRLK